MARRTVAVGLFRGHYTRHAVGFDLRRVGNRHVLAEEEVPGAVRGDLVDRAIRVGDIVASRKRSILRVTIGLCVMAVGYLITIWSARWLGVLG